MHLTDVVQGNLLFGRVVCGFRARGNNQEELIMAMVGVEV